MPAISKHYLLYIAAPFLNRYVVAFVIQFKRKQTFLGMLRYISDGLLVNIDLKEKNKQVKIVPVANIMLLPY